MSRTERIINAAADAVDEVIEFLAPALVFGGLLFLLGQIARMIW